MPPFIYGSIMAMRRAGLAPKINNRGAVMNGLEFYEPADVRDTFIEGIAKIEPVSGGLVRIYLFNTEGFSRPIKVIRARLLLGMERAFELNTEHRGLLTALHRDLKGFKVIGQS